MSDPVGAYRPQVSVIVKQISRQFFIQGAVRNPGVYNIEGRPSLLELITINQQRLIRAPAIIDAVLANPVRTHEAERRVREVRREFFEKERGAQQIAHLPLRQERR